MREADSGAWCQGRLRRLVSSVARGGMITGMGGRGSGGASGAHPSIDGTGPFRNPNANKIAASLGGKLGTDTVQAIHESAGATESEFASIARVRDTLERQGYSAEQTREAILALSRAGSGAYVIPAANRKSLSQHEQDRAVRIGGEANHAIRINPA